MPNVFIFLFYFSFHLPSISSFLGHDVQVCFQVRCALLANSHYLPLSLLVPTDPSPFPSTSNFGSGEMLEKEEILCSVVAHVSPGPCTHCLLTDAAVRCEGRWSRIQWPGGVAGVETRLSVNTLPTDSGRCWFSSLSRTVTVGRNFMAWNYTVVFIARKIFLSLEKICRR